MKRRNSKACFGLIINGYLEDDGHVVRLDLDTGKLIGVKGGLKGVLVYLILVDETAPLVAHRG
jgi:hypothetical protein